MIPNIEACLPPTMTLPARAGTFNADIHNVQERGSSGAKEVRRKLLHKAVMHQIHHNCHPPSAFKTPATASTYPTKYLPHDNISTSKEESATGKAISNCYLRARCSPPAFFDFLRFLSTAGASIGTSRSCHSRKRSM